MEKIFLFIKKDCFQSKFTGNRFLLKEKKNVQNKICTHTQSKNRQTDKLQA